MMSSRELHGARSQLSSEAAARRTTPRSASRSPRGSRKTSKRAKDAGRSVRPAFNEGLPCVPIDLGSPSPERKSRRRSKSRSRSRQRGEAESLGRGVKKEERQWASFAPPSSLGGAKQPLSGNSLPQRAVQGSLATIAGLGAGKQGSLATIAGLGAGKQVVTTALLHRRSAAAKAAATAAAVSPGPPVAAKAASAASLASGVAAAAQANSTASTASAEKLAMQKLSLDTAKATKAAEVARLQEAAEEAAAAAKKAADEVPQLSGPVSPENLKKHQAAKRAAMEAAAKAASLAQAAGKAALEATKIVSANDVAVAQAKSASVHHKGTLSSAPGATGKIDAPVAAPPSAAKSSTSPATNGAVVAGKIEETQAVSAVKEEELSRLALEEAKRNALTRMQARAAVELNPFVPRGMEARAVEVALEQTKPEVVDVHRGTNADLVSVIVDKSSGMSLGVDVEPEGQCIVVTDIEPGLIAEWNSANKPRAIRAGDRILAVNGIRGDGQTLIDMVIKGVKIDMLVAREPR